MNFQEFEIEKYYRQLDQSSFKSREVNESVIKVDDARSILTTAVNELTNDVLEQIYHTATESIKSINSELGDDKNST